MVWDDGWSAKDRWYYYGISHLMDVDLNYSLALSGYSEVDRFFPGTLVSRVISTIVEFDCWVGKHVFSLPLLPL